MKTHLLIVDPQNSFCDPSGELYVAGADKDMEFLKNYILEQGEQVSRITVTLDSHNKMHIAHPIWWMDENGQPPEPFTTITDNSVVEGCWRARNPADQAWSEDYIKKIGSHTIWPYHCLVGTWGHGVFQPLAEVLDGWREKHHELDYLFKGSCRYTEHFSVVRPAVEVPGDPQTFVNTALLRSLNVAERILIAGEASSHCVADSVTDIMQYSENREIGRKIALMTKAMSAVTGFEDRAEEFFSRARERGVQFFGDSSL